MSNKLPREIIISQEELYKCVWSLPLTSVASDLGLSVKRLILRCNELKVPYPHPGYWARKAEGLVVVFRNSQN